MLIREFSPFERIRFVKLIKTTKDYIAEPILGDSCLTSVVAKSDGSIIIPEGKE